MDVPTAICSRRAVHDRGHQPVAADALNDAAMWAQSGVWPWSGQGGATRAKGQAAAASDEGVALATPPPGGGRLDRQVHQLTDGEALACLATPEKLRLENGAHGRTA